MTKRVIVDENTGPGSPLWQLFQQAAGDEPLDCLFLAESHRGIPDVEILDKLLQPGMMLVTSDCVLHTRAIERGIRSYTLNELGQLTRKRLANVKVKKPLPASSHSGLEADYVYQPANDLGQRLKAGLSERKLKRYRTARRRIRSHFGSAAAICQVSVTVGAVRMRGGLLCGYVFHVAGGSGVSGLRASEGYCLVTSDPTEPAWPLFHALRDQYILQLDQTYTQLFLIPPATLELARKLRETQEPLPRTVQEATRRLLVEVPNLTIQPCLKGPFHEAMQAKLGRLATGRSNEVTSIDFDPVIESVLSPEPPRHDGHLP